MDSFREEYYLDKIDSALRLARKNGLISLRDMWAMQDTYYDYDNLAFAWIKLERRLEQIESDYN